MPRPALNLPPSASAVGYNAEGETRRAKEESVACDLFLAVGSSLMVYPAAGIPALAKESGAVLVIVNREPTDLDDLADLVINAEIDRHWTPPWMGRIDLAGVAWRARDQGAYPGISLLDGWG